MQINHLDSWLVRQISASAVYGSGLFGFGCSLVIAVQSWIEAMFVASAVNKSLGRR